MAKKAASPRQRMKQIDREILKLIAERAKLWKKVDLSQPENALVEDQKLVDAMVLANKSDLDSAAISAIYHEIQSGCRNLVQPVKIAFLGPEQSYSYLAALQHFGASPELIPVSTIQAVFEEVQRSNAEFGVVPLENSTDGRIADTLTMFVKSPLKICGEIPFVVHHCLLGIGDKAKVKSICSKPQALSQCREWIAKHYPQAQTVSMASTTAAAKLASEDKTVAAIASEQAGQAFQLKVHHRNIEDNPNNVTRFAVIASETAKRTGKDKTAIMFEILHQPGALADVLNVFKRSKLNMTWIESFPMPNLPNEYLFFVEVEGHQGDAKVRKAFTTLENKTARLVILGSYPPGK